MKTGGEIVLRLVLLGITMGKTQQITAITEQTPCNKSQYTSENFNKCCSRCQPGFFAKQQCNESSDTQCRPCREGTYSSTLNYASNCNKCQPCERSYVLEKNCTSKTDYVCACPAGSNCTQYNVKGRCTYCERIFLPTPVPVPMMVQTGYPPWVMAVLVLSILVLAVTFAALLFCCKKSIVRKCAYIIAKPQMESTDHGAKSPPHQESRTIKVPIAEENSGLGYPIQETDISQSAVLIPNSFSSLSNRSIQ